MQLSTNVFLVTESYLKIFCFKKQKPLQEEDHTVWQEADIDTILHTNRSSVSGRVKTTLKKVRQCLKKKLLSLFLISSVLEGDRRGKKRTSRGDNTGKEKNYNCCKFINITRNK